MITPTRIEVRNIRSIAHAVVEPDPHGITSLAGHVGSGKSTLLNAGVLWALYGEVGGVPGLLSQNEMRRDGCPPGEPAEASCEFTLNSDRYRVVRRLRRSKSGKETASAELWINGAREAQITPSKLTERVTALTGLSGRAFAGAFFIPQGNLPALAEGTPADVQRLVEDQTGLSVLSRRIDTARQEANAATAHADALPGSFTDAETAQADLDAAQTAGETAWVAWESAKAAADLAETCWVQARADADALAGQAAAAEHARLRVARAEARLAVQNERVADLTTQVERHPAVDAQDARQAVSNLRAAINTVEQTRRVAADAADAVADATDALTTARRAVTDRPDPSRQLTQARADAATAAGQIAAARAEYERVGKSLTTLQTAVAAGAACCPTCTQSLPDPTGLITHLTTLIEHITNQGHAARQAHNTATDQIAGLERDLTAWQAATTRVSAAEATLGTATARAQATQDRALAAHATLAEILTVPPTITHSELIHAARAAEDTHAARIAAADLAARYRADLAAATQDRDATAAELAAATAAANTGPHPDVVAAAVERAATEQAGWRTLAATAAQAHTDAKVAAERVRAAEHTRDHAQAQLTAKATAVEHADTLRHAVHVLVALRRDLLAEYTATISQSATDLMAQVGAGDHIGVVLDETFVPRVILADGRERPMRVLSGGEKMRAALCLRLGIADQITGTTGSGMIFADEITANHDPDTTALIVELIRNLGRPMVIVAHADEVTQAANRVFRFTKSTEQTTTVADANTLARTA